MSIRNKYNLPIKKRIPVTSNGKTIVLGEELEFIEGSGTLDFNGFPILQENPVDGSLIASYARTTGHGAAWSDGAGQYGIISTDGGITWGTPFLLRASTNPALGTSYSTSNRFITPTGRMVFVGYTAGESGGRIPFSAINDDFLNSTDYTFIKMNNDYDLGGYQLDCTGSYILYEGKHYQACYGRASSSGARHAMIYKNENNGDPNSWTKLSNISLPAGVGDYEEPGIAAFLNKIIVGILRSDALDRSDFVYSLDGGIIWSRPQNIGYPSIGKNPVAISPNGTILTVGRDATTERIIYTWSNDYGKTWAAPQFASESTNYYTYAGLVWKDGRFVCVWSGDENFPSGPANLYRTFFYEEDL